MSATIHSIKDYDKRAATYRECLTRFLSYFSVNINDTVSGRKVFRHHGVIYWPDFADAMRRSRVWLDAFWPKAMREQSRRNYGVPPTGPEYRSWFRRALRRHVDTLLAPLLIPTTSLVGGDYISYAIEQRGVGEDRIEDVNPERWATLNDPANYTFFRHFRRLTDKTLERILLMPPDFDEFQLHQHAVPPEIAALYYAWRTITHRHKAAYDPSEVGVEWASAGLLFVNWALFLNSPFCPPVSVEPAQCATFLRGGSMKGRWQLRLSAFPDPLKHETLPEETRAIDPDTFQLGDVWGSLVDPLYLVQKDQIFTATFQKERARRRAVAQKRAQMRTMERLRAKKIAGQDVAPTKQAKVYSFNFRASQYPLPSTHLEGYYKWFDDHVDEDVYAVKYKGNLFFAEPERLRTDFPPVERDAWFRAMDALSCVAQFAASGDIESVKPKRKIDIARKLQEDEWIKTATERIEGFMSLDNLSRAELRRIKQQTRYRLAASGEGPPGGQSFYHAKLLELASKSLPILAVRKEAYCVLPGRNEDKPRKHVFYSVHAIKQFAQAANQSPPAPYLYAWAKFCLYVDAVGLDAVVSRRRRLGARFTPQDDLVLIENFRRHPKMTRDERATLLSRLSSWSWKSLQLRINALNKLLKPLLSSSRREKYTIGKLWLPGVAQDARQWEYKRLMLLIGLALQLQGEGDTLHTKLPIVADVFELTHAQLRNLTLDANNYRNQDFEVLVRKAVRG